MGGRTKENGIEEKAADGWLSQRGLSHRGTVKVAQSCLTLCNPMDYTVHGILQARILEWVAFPSSRRFSQPRDRTHISYAADIGRWVFYH